MVLHIHCLCFSRDPGHWVFDPGQLTSSCRHPLHSCFLLYLLGLQLLAVFRTPGIYLILARVAQQTGPEPLPLTGTPMWGPQIFCFTSSLGSPKGGQWSQSPFMVGAPPFDETLDATSLFPKIFQAFPFTQLPIEISRNLGRV